MLVGVSLAFLAVGGTYLTIPCSGGNGLGPGVLAGNLTYVSESIEVPANTTNATSSGPLTEVSFQGVQFQLWPIVLSGQVYALDVAAAEPTGVTLAHGLFANRTADPDGQNWTSPDGVLGASFVNATATSVGAVLRVAVPVPNFLRTIAGVTPLSTQSYCFDRVQFQLSVVGYGSPGGDSLVALVTEPNGTVYQLVDSNGPPSFACGSNFPSILPGATCLETASPDHGVAIVWDGQSTTYLFVEDW